MSTLPHRYVATLNTPLKLRTTSVPTTGKVFKVDDINQDLLVELDGATIDEDPLTPSHYVLGQYSRLSPAIMEYIPPGMRDLPLRVEFLKLKDKYLYHDDRWELGKIPHILRSSNSSSVGSTRSSKKIRSSSQKGHLTSSRHETISRHVTENFGETIQGTFIPAAGSEEKHISAWLNEVTEALQAFIPTGTVLGRIIPDNLVKVTRRSTKTSRVWSWETSCKPIKDGPMVSKPDVVLWERPPFGPQPEFSWKDVISFVELTSTAYSNSITTGTV